MCFTLQWTGRRLTYYCKHSLQTSELAPSNSPPQMARWREKREMGQEEEQQPGNSAESPSTEQWHSTWSCRCAQEQEQSKAAKSCSETHQHLPARAEKQLCKSRLLQHWQSTSRRAGMGYCAWGGPSSCRGNAALDTCADPPLSGQPRKFCWATFHTLTPAKKRFQDKIPCQDRKTEIKSV